MVDEDKPQRFIDYFVVAGLGKKSKPSDVDKRGDGESTSLEPITDLAVIFKSFGEKVPSGYTIIDKSPSGLSADLNHGSIRQPSCFLCYKRGLDKPPLTDIGVLYDGKELPIPGCDVITHTPNGKSANVNNSGGSRTFITYRRALQKMVHTSLAVTEICVIIASKGEKPPHAFCLIEKNLNKGMFGSDVFLCYRKSLSRQTSIICQPEILSRFPPVDYKDFPLPELVPLFCLPFGTIIQCWPEKCEPPPPSFSTFVLSKASRQKVYGAAVTFFEKLPDELSSDPIVKALQLDELRKTKKTVNPHINKCICILSHWPFLEAFKKSLLYLLCMSVFKQPIPIEFYITNLMLDVPFPSPQRPRILIEMVRYDPFVITQLCHTPLPVSGASYRELLIYLGPDNVLLLFYLVLTEQKILFHSLRPALLTIVAEALTAILFPFTWQCLYIPLCPVALKYKLHAPCPFIIGIDSRHFDQYNPPDDVTSIDLDTNMVCLSSKIKSVSWKSLPKKPGKILKDSLTELFYPMYQQYHKETEEFGTDITGDTTVLPHLYNNNTHSRRRLSLEVSIQEAFLRFMATILRGYGNYLLPITSGPTKGACNMTSPFDMQGFLKSRPSSHQSFFNLLIHTQMFSRFIEQRSFISAHDSLLAFFDKCAEKLDSTKPLIEVDEPFAKDGQRTYVVFPPGIPIVTEKLCRYPTFPILNEKLFLFKRDGPPAASSMVEIPSPIIVNPKMDYMLHLVWASCLMANCYILWFTHLPSYVKENHNRTKVIRFAYEVLCKMEKKGVSRLTDEVFTVLMQLCDQFCCPALAVKVYLEMKRQRIQPTSITYNCYKRAVREGKWPKNTTSSQLWKKVRNVFAAVYQFEKLAHFQQVTNEGELDTSLSSSADGFPFGKWQKRNWGIISYRPKITWAFSDKPRHDQMFFNTSSEGGDQSEPNEDIMMALDDDIFRLPHGLRPDTALEVLLGTCFQCIKCERYIYDEEIMAGWTEDDSNLNTSCQFCNTQQVASLNIKIKDYRNCFSSRPSSDLDAISQTPEVRDNITVAYISPLVLRKELENMLEDDGNESLNSPDMVQQKDIVYWNLVWIFNRLKLPSHLPDFLLTSYPGDKIDKSEERQPENSSEVLITTSWDADRQELDSIPMYVLWNSPVDHQERGFTPRSVMKTVIDHIKANDVLSAIKMLLDERIRQKQLNPQIRWSVHRELMFLSLTACGSDHIDVEAYDFKYRKAYKELLKSKDYNDKLILEDHSPTKKIAFCRCLFSNLTLQPKLPDYINSTPLI